MRDWHDRRIADDFHFSGHDDGAWVVDVAVGCCAILPNFVQKFLKALAVMYLIMYFIDAYVVDSIPEPKSPTTAVQQSVAVPAESAPASKTAAASPVLTAVEEKTK